MSKKATEFERASRDEDEVISGYAELQRSKDYSDERLYSTNRLEALGMRWLAEENNPLRSARGQAEAKHITKLITFEIAYRTDRIQLLIDFYGSQEVE